MIRNLKALGLAVVAVLSMSAFVASAAQAEATTDKFKAETGNYPVSFHGSSAAGNEVFTTEAGKVECASSYTGSAGEAAQTVTSHPVYTGCKAFGFLEATVNTTGCDYTFNLTTKIETDKYVAHVDVHCESGKSIVITAATCEVNVGSHTGYTDVGIEVMTPASGHKDLTIDATVSGITYTVVKDGFGCPFNGTGAKNGGTYETGSPVTVTGTGEGLTIG